MFFPLPIQPKNQNIPALGNDDAETVRRKRQKMHFLSLKGKLRQGTSKLNSWTSFLGLPFSK